MEVNKIFPIRKDLMVGDSIVVIKDDKSFSGIFYASESEDDVSVDELTENLKFYTRYTTICVGKNLKRFYIFRNTFDKISSTIIVNSNDLKIFFTKVVLVEKFKKQALKERKMAWQ